jgi:hypothetical protein
MFLAEFFGLPGWIIPVWAGVVALLCLACFLFETDTGDKWRTYISRWIHGWRRVHTELVVFNGLEEVKPIELFSYEMKMKIDKYGGMDSVKISSTGYIDWYTGQAHKYYTLWAQPKKRANY